jgi:hypothetical protein
MLECFLSLRTLLYWASKSLALENLRNRCDYNIQAIESKDLFPIASKKAVPFFATTPAAFGGQCVSKGGEHRAEDPSHSAGTAGNSGAL